MVRIMNYRPEPEPIVGINMMKHSKGAKLPKEFLPVRQLADVPPTMKAPKVSSFATKFAKDFLEEKKRMELLDTYKEKLSQQMNTNSGYEQLGTNTFVSLSLKKPDEKAINTIPGPGGDDIPPPQPKLPPQPKPVIPENVISEPKLPPPPSPPQTPSPPDGASVLSAPLQQQIIHHHHLNQHFHDNRQFVQDSRQFVQDSRQFINDSRQNILDQRSNNLILNADQLNTANGVKALLYPPVPTPLGIMPGAQIEELMDYEDEPQITRNSPLLLEGPVVTSPIGQLVDPQQMIEYQKVQSRRQTVSSLASFKRNLAQESRSAEQKLRNLAQASRSTEQQLRNAAQASRSADQKLRNAAQASRSQLQKMRNQAQITRSESQRLKNLQVQPYDSPLLARGSLSPSTMIQSPPTPIRGAPEYTQNIQKTKLFTRVVDPGWLGQGLDDKLPVLATKRKGANSAEDSFKKRKPIRG